MELAEAFPAGRFEPPASLEAIMAAEAQLDVRFPEQLRALYLECDGFREPMGNAAYLFPLSDAVKNTAWLWREIGGVDS